MILLSVPLLLVVTLLVIALAPIDVDAGKAMRQSAAASIRVVG